MSLPPQQRGLNVADLMKGRLAAQDAQQRQQINQQNMEFNQVRMDQERLDNDLKRTQIARQTEDDADDEIYNSTMAAAGPDADWKTVRDQLATKVKPRNLTRYDTETDKAVKTWNSLESGKRKKIEDAHKAIGDELIAISLIPKGPQRQLAYTSAKARLEQGGLIKPGSYPEEAPDDEVLDSYIANHGQYGNKLAMVQKQAAANLNAEKERAEKIKADRAEVSELKQEFWQGLQANDDLTNEEYQRRLADKKYDKIREDLPPTLENPKTGRTRAHTIESIRKGALTAKELGQEADKAADNAETAKNHQRQFEHDKAMESIARFRAERSRNQTANASATDRREWQKEMNKLEEDEEKRRRLRSSLEIAIATGKDYVKETGEKITMDAMLKESDSATKEALLADMKGRYQNLGSELRRVVNDKYLTGEALGAKGSVPKEKVLAKLDEDEKRVLGGQSAAGTATPAGSPAPAPAAAPPPVAKFDTPLNTAEEAKFQEWKKKNAPNDSGEDYDLRGAFKADLAGKLPRDARNHTGDEHKKPNHPSFSQDSRFSGKDGNIGGRWAEENGQTVFYASPTNLKHNSPEQLKEYFKREEPNVKLVLPGAKPAAQSPAPVTPPPTNPTPAKDNAGSVTVKLPTGKYITGPKEKIEEFMKANGLKWAANQ